MSISDERLNNASGLLDADTPETVRLTPAEARAVGARALGRIGYSDGEVEIIIDQLIDNALCGYKFAGLPRILAIARNRKRYAPKKPIAIVKETPASALIDGGNNVGYLAAHRGASVAIEKARYCGLSAVGVFDTYYSGRNAYYAEMMANAGLVAIHVASGEPKVLPPGAARPVMGTNPMSFGFPASGGAVVFDMGTASIMGGEMLLYSLQGKPLPEGMAFDADGKPTRDPQAAFGGGISPFGGHKGYGLSFCVQALGILAGAAFGDQLMRHYGFLFLAIRPDILLPAEEFPLRMAELVQYIKNIPRQPGVDEIRIPSERAARERGRRRHEGIVIDRTIVDQLNAL